MSATKMFEAQSATIVQLLANAGRPMDVEEIAKLASLPAAQINRVLYKLKSKTVPDVQEVHDKDGKVRHRFIGVLPSTASSAPTKARSSTPAKQKKAGDQAVVAAGLPATPRKRPPSRQADANIKLAIAAIKSIGRDATLAAIAKKMKLPSAVVEITLYTLRQKHPEGVIFESDGDGGFVYHHANASQRRTSAAEPAESGAADASETIATRAAEPVLLEPTSAPAAGIERDILLQEVHAIFKKPGMIAQAAKALNVSVAAIQPVVIRLSGLGFLKSEKLMGTPVFKIAKPLTADLVGEIAIAKSVPVPAKMAAANAVATHPAEPVTAPAAGNIKATPPTSRSDNRTKATAKASPASVTTSGLSDEVKQIVKQLSASHQQMEERYRQSAALFAKLLVLLADE